jgi:hypothetical protein
VAATAKPETGYDRIVGALANLGHRLSDQTVGNVLRRHGISPAPKRKQSNSWKDVIRSERSRVDYLLCAVLHPPGESPSEAGRIHAVP